ncbi:twin-arginine translocation pathway signal protein [Jannaschia sp. Os4]|uniref:Acg family FMN-binding oxidoreductase n=1 Tax=Jannaschia sp. Os4 TaxID=2807617 RepID=UPI00193A5136|nr:twin-arginine translocation pathway signal protein [Jannaschia sp. Os4]MBM2577591.1 twin-arginine translocation pathway signal protein [Jannaschia sp. Os4]
MSRPSRRAVLSLVGGGTVLAATGGAAAFALTRTPHAALAPWDAAGTYADPRMRALSFGLLAPNPHNRQPWTAELVGDDGIVLRRDPARDLPVTDPFARQLTIGMGCFVELCRMAAAADGHATATDLFPEGEDGPVAVLRLAPGGTPDPLFAHVMDRRSHKEAFEDRAVTLDAAAPLAGLGRLHLDGPVRDELRALAADAWVAEITTPEALRESTDLLRIGRAEIEANPDGIDLGGPMMEGLALAGILTREAAGDIDNPTTRAVMERDEAVLRAAPALVSVATRGNDRLAQMEAGRRWMRLNLAATGAGLALRPVSQALQEYDAVAPMRAAVHDLVAAEGETVQMLGLLGYGARTPRTPRWPLETRMVDGRA